jgi:DNA modification methylase
MLEEKRKYLRFEVLVPVELVEFEGIAGEDAKAILDNVSREGVRLVLNMHSSPGAGTEINFTFHNAEKHQSFDVTGEVIWSKPNGEKLEIGLKIKSIEKTAKADLLDMGYSHWKDELTHPKKPS